MLRPIDLISTDPGVERLSIPRLSLSHYNKLAQKHLSHIDEIKQTLQRISLPFNGSGTILPISCVEAVRTLSKLNNCVEEFCGLLDETSRLPLALLGLRYELLYLCYQITAQVDKLQDLIDNYRKICMSPSPSSLRKQIYHTFQDVFQLISDTSRQVKDQDETARFQEKRLILIYE